MIRNFFLHCSWNFRTFVYKFANFVYKFMLHFSYHDRFRHDPVLPAKLNICKLSSTLIFGVSLLNLFNYKIPKFKDHFWETLPYLVFHKIKKIYILNHVMAQKKDKRSPFTYLILFQKYLIWSQNLKMLCLKRNLALVCIRGY